MEYLLSIVFVVMSLFVTAPVTSLEPVIIAVEATSTHKAIVTEVSIKDAPKATTVPNKAIMVADVPKVVATSSGSNSIPFGVPQVVNLEPIKVETPQVVYIQPQVYITQPAPIIPDIIKPMPTPTCTLEVSATEAPVNSLVTLTWTSENATKGTIKNSRVVYESGGSELTTLNGSGQFRVSSEFPEDNVFTITFSNKDGSVTCTKTVMTKAE